MCSHCDFHRATGARTFQKPIKSWPFDQPEPPDTRETFTVEIPDSDFKDIVFELPKPKMTTYIPSVLPEYATHPPKNRFTALLREIEQMHLSKQEGYGTVEDPFSNLRASEKLGIPAWKGALVRLNDKIARLNNYALYETLPHEGVSDNFKDAASYAILALVLLEETLRKADAP